MVLYIPPSPRSSIATYALHSQMQSQYVFTMIHSYKSETNKRGYRSMEWADARDDYVGGGYGGMRVQIDEGHAAAFSRNGIYHGCGNACL